MVRMVTNKPQTTSKELQEHLAVDNWIVHHSTVQHTLYKEQLNGKMMQKKPFLCTPNNQVIWGAQTFAQNCLNDLMYMKQCQWVGQCMIIKCLNFIWHWTWWEMDVNESFAFCPLWRCTWRISLPAYTTLFVIFT